MLTFTNVNIILKIDVEIGLRDKICTPQTTLNFTMAI